MNRSPAFQFYPDKWLSHTKRLSDSAYRVYHELLCWMWQQADDQCSIEATAEAVCCAVAMPMSCVKDACAEIQNAYAPLLKAENGRWVSNGLRKEVEKQIARREQCRKAADARHKAPDALKNDASAPITQCITSTSTSTSTKSKSKTRALELLPKGNPEWWAEFWKEFPRKEAKKQAITEWNKLPLTGELIDKMLDALHVQKLAPKWAKEKVFVYACRWLKNSRWEDEIDQTEIPEVY